MSSVSAPLAPDRPPTGLPAVPALETEAPWRARLFPNNEWVLLVVLLVECVIFGVTGRNFLSAGSGTSG